MFMNNIANDSPHQCVSYDCKTWMVKTMTIIFRTNF